MTLPDPQAQQVLLYDPPADDPTAVPVSLRVYVSDGGALLREVAPEQTPEGQWFFAFPALPDGSYFQRLGYSGIYGLDSQDGPLVLPLSVALPVTLLEAKAHLNITDAQDDEELTGMLRAALEVVEREVGPLSPREVTELVSESATEHVLQVQPVLSVSTGSLGANSLLTIPRGTTSVTYTAGRTEPTPAQRLAVLMVLKDFWTTQRGQGFPTDEDGNYVVAPVIQRRVRELLAGTQLLPAIG